jgi:hypothetical protein
MRDRILRHVDDFLLRTLGTTLRFFNHVTPTLRGRDTSCPLTSPENSGPIRSSPSQHASASSRVPRVGYRAKLFVYFELVKP